jgi:hypothetical protein
MLYLLLLLLLPTLQLAQLCPVQETPADALGPFYQQNSPVGSVVAPASELTNPLELLQVSGRILSITDCEKGIANVTVEVWFAGAVKEVGIRALCTSYSSCVLLCSLLLPLTTFLNHNLETYVCSFLPAA